MDNELKEMIIGFGCACVLTIFCFSLVATMFFLIHIGMQNR